MKLFKTPLKILVKSTWFEIAVLGLVDLILFIITASVYSMSGKLLPMLGFFFFLVAVIFQSYKQKYLNLNFNLPPKAQVMLFIRACTPYILQAVLFTECALLVAWILFNGSVVKR